MGFDPISRGWVTRRSARGSTVPVPPLKGQLLFSDSALSAASDDFGHIVHHRPWAVLEPGDVNDIVVMLRFCNEQRIQAAPRGQGHGTFGQAQVSGGLVIDMSPLDAISVAAGGQPPATPRSVTAGGQPPATPRTVTAGGQPPATPRTVTAGTATVQAGARWSSLLQATLPDGLSPPVLTDYLELSVGGTLSVGGMGGTSPHYGAQVDNVLELQVVTGAGDLVSCSATSQPDLFHAVLAGLGQCAVLVGATLRLVPAPANVRHYILFYPTADALTADQRLVQADGRFSFAEGEAQLNPSGPGWQFYLEAGAYYDSTPPDDQELIGDLHYQRGTEQIDTLGYFDFLDRLAPAVAFLESTGEWFDPHPWWNMFLPDSATDAFVTGVMTNLTEADIGASGVILLYPLRRAELRAPLLRVPDEPTVFLFSVLRTAAPDTGALGTDVMLRDNRALFEQGRGLGGYEYPIGSIPMSPGDWRQHYGPQWQLLAAAKHRYDPRGILTPGQGIFTPAKP
jgi:FAD/FMN-containing dehydrogenase